MGLKESDKLMCQNFRAQVVLPALRPVSHLTPTLPHHYSVRQIAFLCPLTLPVSPQTVVLLTYLLPYCPHLHQPASLGSCLNFHSELKLDLAPLVRNCLEAQTLKQSVAVSLPHYHPTAGR